MPRQNDEKFVKMLAERLRQLRKERGYTQEYVVERTHLNIACFETGSTTPTMHSILKFCELYGITVREFFAPFDYPSKI